VVLICAFYLPDDKMCTNDSLFLTNYHYENERMMRWRLAHRISDDGEEGSDEENTELCEKARGKRV